MQPSKPASRGFLPGAGLASAALLSACIFGGGGTEAGGGGTETDRVHYVQGLEVDGDFLRTRYNLCDTVYNDLEYRRSGDMVEVEWGQAIGQEQLPVVDIYRRKADGAFPNGVWTRLGSRVRASSSALETHAEAIEAGLAFQDSVYGDEVIHVRNGIAGFAYSKLFLYPLREAGQNNPEIDFTYVGGDSLVMKHGGETVTVKYIPFDRLDIRSSDPEHESIHARLDSCSVPEMEVYESSWLQDFLGQGIEREKRAASAKAPGRGAR